MILRATPAGQRGSVIVESVIAMLSISVLLCAFLEFGVMTSAYMALDNAVNASCKELSLNTELNQTQLKSIAIQAEPALKSNKLTLAYSVSEPTFHRYMHNLPDGAGSRESTTHHKDVGVSLSYRLDAITFIGKLLYKDDVLEIKASTSLVADSTIEGGQRW